MRILTCLAAEHDPGLVLLAAAICGLGAWVSVRLCAHVRGTFGWSRAGWVFLGAVAVGATVWCTHFVAMLAYRPGVAVSYGPGLTALSLLVAILGCGAGLTLAASGGRRAASAGGAVLGAGIAVAENGAMVGVVTPSSLLLGVKGSTTSEPALA